MLWALARSAAECPVLSLKSDIEEAEAVWQYACASPAAVEPIVRSALKPADMAPILQVPPASAHNIVFVNVVTGHPPWNHREGLIRGLGGAGWVQTGMR